MNEDIIFGVKVGGVAVAFFLFTVWFRKWYDRRQIDKYGPDALDRRDPGWLRVIAFLLGGIVLGLVTRAFYPVFQTGFPWEILPALIVLVQLSLGSSAVENRGVPNGIWACQLEIFAMWTAWILGWSLAERPENRNPEDWALYGWLGCAVVGGIIVLSGRTRHAKS